MRTLRLLAVLAAGLGLHAAAQAQFLSGSCVGGACARSNSGTYGPALFGANPSGKIFSNRPMGGCEPYCAVNSYPLSDWAYIRKFCGPQLIPGSCYGHFQTKWRKWEDHCPDGNGGDGQCAPGGLPINEQPIVISPQPMIPVQPGTTLGEPRPVDVPRLDMPKQEVPKIDLPKVNPMPPANPNKAPGSSISTTVPAPMPAVIQPSHDGFVPSVVRPQSGTAPVIMPGR
jgi:hypothetical protein